MLTVDMLTEKIITVALPQKIDLITYERLSLFCGQPSVRLMMLIDDMLTVVMPIVECCSHPALATTHEIDSTR